MRYQSMILQYVIQVGLKCWVVVFETLSKTSKSWVFDFWTTCMQIHSYLELQKTKTLFEPIIWTNQRYYLKYHANQAKTSLEAPSQSSKDIISTDHLDQAKLLFEPPCETSIDIIEAPSELSKDIILTNPEPSKDIIWTNPEPSKDIIRTNHPNQAKILLEPSTRTKHRYCLNRPSEPSKPVKDIIWAGHLNQAKILFEPTIWTKQRYSLKRHANQAKMLFEVPSVNRGVLDKT